ncbi:Heat shock cognate 70 kDa protein [Linum perenne]
MAGEGEDPAIGIDLGTTYSCVGVWQHDSVEIIANDQWNMTTPSYGGFHDTERLIGDVAMNPINTVFGFHTSYVASPIIIYQTSSVFYSRTSSVEVSDKFRLRFSFKKKRIINTTMGCYCVKEIIFYGV